jgi:hypothetical protein
MATPRATSKGLQEGVQRTRQCHGDTWHYQDTGQARLQIDSGCRAVWPYQAAKQAPFRIGSGCPSVVVYRVTCGPRIPSQKAGCCRSQCAIEELPKFEEQFFGYAADGPTREEREGKKALFTTLRMWVHIIKARVMALRETEAENKQWDCIYKELNYARAAASRDLAHRRAIVELFSAVVTSQHIERLILPKSLGLPLNTDNDGETSPSAKCRLLRLVLDRAKEQLGKGRRNTRWWRLYFRLEIRWALWELLSLKRQIELQKFELERPEEVVARLLETVRCGLAAMSSRIDLDFGYANSYADFCKQPFENLHQWWEVLGRFWASTIFCISAKMKLHVKDKYKIDIDAEEIWNYSLKVHYPWLSRVVGLPMPKGLPAGLHDGNPQEKNHELLKPLMLERWVSENTSVLTLMDPG